MISPRSVGSAGGVFVPSLYVSIFRGQDNISKPASRAGITKFAGSQPAPVVRTEWSKTGANCSAPVLQSPYRDWEHWTGAPVMGVEWSIFGNGRLMVIIRSVRRALRQDRRPALAQQTPVAVG